jgi:Fe-S-cluster formation regulator IscX/YfhJ
MTRKTLSELRLKHAQLTDRAEALRQQQRAAVPTTPRFTALSRQIRDVQARADDYAALLELVKTKEG